MCVFIENQTPFNIVPLPLPPLSSSRFLQGAKAGSQSEEEKKADRATRFGITKIGITSSKISMEGEVSNGIMGNGCMVYDDIFCYFLFYIRFLFCFVYNSVSPFLFCFSLIS